MGGVRQMLAFASGVGTSPTLIALDEPTSGLGPVVVQSLVGKILRSRAEGCSILWVVEEDPSRSSLMSIASTSWVQG
jgi:ABC-type branched-subunit amino acid transport system ATPase component